MRRSVDLLQMLWDEEGTLQLDGSETLPSGNGVVLYPLPWRSPTWARAISRPNGPSSGEMTLALALPKGATWCTTELNLEPESRLRFEPVSLDTSRPGRARVLWTPKAGAAWEAQVEASTTPDALQPQADIPLPSGAGSLCLRAEGGAVSIGEPRIVAPEVEGSDARPRVIVLILVDALRADVLEAKEAEKLLPAIASLARSGHSYKDAVSVGSHTFAGLWPLTVGRDLFRIDPFLSDRGGAQLPFSEIFSRANIPISQLARAAGYHSIFIGNNSFFHTVPLFERFSNHGSPATGTVDTIAALPPLLERYADERIFLFFYVSAIHSVSLTPTRLLDDLGCGSLAGRDASRCEYQARAAHADEAVDALEQGLEFHGLRRKAFQVLVADHGEALHDGIDLEIRRQGTWLRTAVGHGWTLELQELRVPLLVNGPGIEPATWAGRVSLLDVLPTIARVGGFPTPHRLDGRLLPLSGGERTPAGALTINGFCSHGMLDQQRKLVWWNAECSERRDTSSGRVAKHRIELWQDEVLKATDESAPNLLGQVREQLGKLASRLPGEAWMLDLSKLGQREIVVSVREGRISDWGPSSGYGNLTAVEATLSADERRLRVTSRNAPGVFSVSTWPADVPIQIDVAGGNQSVVTLVGKLQLPLDIRGRQLDPKLGPSMWIRKGSSPMLASATRSASMGIWRQPFGDSAESSDTPVLSAIDAVMREWGYIR